MTLGGRIQLRPNVDLVELLSGVQARVRTEVVIADTRDTISLTGQTHFLVHGEAGVRRVQQSVFFVCIDRHVVVVAHARIDELDHHFLLVNGFDIAVTPIFKRIGRGLAAALFHWAVVIAARGMGIDLVGRPEHDINASAISHPSGLTGGEMFVGVRDAAVMLFLVLVLDGVGRGIATEPELFDELISLFVVGELLKRRKLFRRDDPAHVFVQPLLVGRAQFLLECLGVGFLLLFGQRSLERIR